VDTSDVYPDVLSDAFSSSSQRLAQLGRYWRPARRASGQPCGELHRASVPTAQCASAPSQCLGLRPCRLALCQREACSHAERAGRNAASAPGTRRWLSPRLSLIRTCDRRGCAHPAMREDLRIDWSKVSADVMQGEPHVSSRGEAVNAGWGACLDEKLCKARVEVKANRSRVGHRYVDHGPRIRERVVAVAEEPIEQDADGEQVGGDVPASEAGVGWLIRRCA
jgi:hypothetical protein